MYILMIPKTEGNYEKEHSKDRFGYADYAYVKDGELVIQPVKTEENGKVSYASGRVNTQNKHDYKYGRFEARLPEMESIPCIQRILRVKPLTGKWR